MSASIDEDDELRGGMAMPREMDAGNRLVWVAISVLGFIVLAYAAWLGNSVTTLQQEVAGITAKLDIVLADRNDAR